VAGFVVVLTSIISPDGVFTFLLQSSGATILSVYLLISLSQIALRRRIEATGERLSVKVWAFPAVSYAAVGGIMAVLVMMALMPDQRLQVVLSLGSSWPVWRPMACAAAPTAKVRPACAPTSDLVLRFSLPRPLAPSPRAGRG
jgi:L-asparagine transporter-like permease